MTREPGSLEWMERGDYVPGLRARARHRLTIDDVTYTRNEVERPAVVWHVWGARGGVYLGAVERRWGAGVRGGPLWQAYLPSDKYRECPLQGRTQRTRTRAAARLLQVYRAGIRVGGAIVDFRPRGAKT